MLKDASSPKQAWGPFKFIKDIIHHIFNYLSCNADDPTDNKMRLRNLYNTGHLDEDKYHHFREKCLNDNFDPEEIHEA